MIDVALYLGEFEPDVVAAIEQYCRKGGTVLDIGANIGAHTLRIARAVGETGKVFAFEPTTYAHSKLIRNLSLNHFTNIEVEKLALSDVASEQTRLLLRASWRTDGHSVSEEEPIRLARLDDWSEARGITRIDLVKVDVDGREFGVLKGGKGSIERFRPVLLIEAGAYHFENPETNPFRLLGSLGYVFSNARGLKTYPNWGAILEDCAGVDSINLIAIPSRQAELIEASPPTAGRRRS